MDAVASLTKVTEINQLFISIRKQKERGKT